MNRSLSFEDILAALAVLSVNVATAGCSKTAPSPDKDTAAIANATAGSDAAGGAPAAGMPAAPTSEVDSRETNVDAVDAGGDVAPRPLPHGSKAPSASCGAQGCSPDMKKKGSS